MNFNLEVFRDVFVEGLYDFRHLLSNVVFCKEDVDEAENIAGRFDGVEPGRKFLTQPVMG